MKKLTIFFIITAFLASTHAFSAEKGRSLLEKLFNKDLPGGAVSRSNKKNEISNQKITNIKNNELCEKKVGQRSILEKVLSRDLPGGNARKNLKKKCPTSSKQVKLKESQNFFSANSNSQNVSVYTGTFDTKDERGDDETSLFGVEHKNKNLFRSTWLGRLSPTTGAFVTKKNSVYLYTGIEADYNVGLVNISPSFAPGYYQAGNGKNLGSALEFKSELKIGVDLFKNTNLGYSYSHISNNDWGDVNPGTDNQTLTLSKKF
jgi:lipid A 3-O-deacylase